MRTILECAMLEEGSEGKSFDTIVASGERSAYPHGVATGKVLEDGDLVTFDFGAIYKGYHSDITRTVAIGDVSERLQKIYDSVLRCNEHIEMQLKEGIICSEVDKLAREYLKKMDLRLISSIHLDIVWGWRFMNLHFISTGPYGIERKYDRNGGTWGIYSRNWWSPY